MSARLRAWKAAGVVTICVAPSAAMNVWPKLSHMWFSGVADGYSVGIALFWAAAVVIMALCPITFDRARNWRVRVGSTALCAVLASLTFSNAVDVAGKVQFWCGTYAGVDRRGCGTQFSHRRCEEVSQPTPAGAAGGHRGHGEGGSGCR